MTYKSLCPICKTDAVATFLMRECIPVHQNLVLRSQESALAIARGDLELGVCEACGFVFNQAFDLAKISYGHQYDNTQTCSPFFKSYTSDLVHQLVSEKDVRNKRIVEVGCGKGAFLRELVEFDGAGNTGYGFDPSYVGPEVALGGRLRFEKKYYTIESANVPADVVICRHVIEHIPDPVAFLSMTKQILAHSPYARLFFETPCLEWILRNRVIWDFFYEHCSYFTAESLTTAFESAGFRIEDVRHVFEGQYLWLEARIPGEMLSVNKNPGSIPALAHQFAVLEGGIKNSWLDRVQELASKGNVALWGAGAKGTTFASLLDPNRQWISCVVDLNPNKQGCYLAGTGHPIVSHWELKNHAVATAILLNPNYYKENLALLHEAQLSIDLITFE